jgi:hypothetical protein
MTIELLTLAIAAMTTFSPTSPRPVDNKHFIIHGEIVELDPINQKEQDAPATQVIIYQEDEIYVAFDSNVEGKFEFNLPIDHIYTVTFGGDKFVNKIIEIDARNLNKKKYGHHVELDMGLFQEYDGVDYEFLNEPVATFRFDETVGSLAPDMAYTSKKSKQVFKCIKKIMKLHG